MGENIINKETRIIALSHLKESELQGETIILDVETGQYYGLEGIGRLLWENMQSPNSVGELAEIIQSTYEVDAHTCLEDVTDFVRELADHGLVTIVAN